MQDPELRYQQSADGATLALAQVRQFFAAGQIVHFEFEST
jgi:hypothetical protein